MATIVPVAPGAGGTLGAGGAPDADLVDGLRAGSRDAFEHLYELYRARIYNLALRIVQSPEDARDITQDVFVKVYRRLPGSGRTDLQLKPWLYRVAVNACYDHLRTRKAHRDIDLVTDTRAWPIDTFEQAEMSRLVERTLGDLSERHRTVLVLKDIHGLHHDEIAGILGVSRGATETLLFRARESFRTRYGELTGDLPAAACTVARDAALAAVGGELSDADRRRVLGHAAHCPTCSKTVKTWGTAAVGLGLFIHNVSIPAALQGAFPFGAAGATGAGATAATGTLGAGAGSSGGSALAGAAGVAAGGAGTTAASSTGFTLATGGVLAKVGGAATAKVAALIIAATCTAGGGVAAYETGVIPGVHQPHRQPAATKAHDRRPAAADGQSGKSATGQAAAVADSGRGATRSAAAHAKGKGKTDAARSKNAGGKETSAAAKSKSNGEAKSSGRARPGGSGNGTSNGKAAKAAKATKPAKVAKVTKSAKATKPTKPPKPAKPAKPPKPAKPAKPPNPAKPTKPPKPPKSGTTTTT
jgi:RNA polymerase sigma-70 factor, ECF subfamily